MRINTAPRIGQPPLISQSSDNRWSLLTKGIVWVTIILMVVPHSFLLLPEDEASGGNWSTRVLRLLILALSLVVVLSRIRLTLRLLRQVNVFFLFFVGLAIASLAWSIDPGLTLRRIVLLLMMSSTFLASTVTAWNPRRFQQIVRPVLTLLLIGSLVFGLTNPELAIQQDTAPELLNAWRGLTFQKNALGAVASFGFLLWLHAWLARETKPLSALIGGTAAAVCLVLSRSATSLIATVFASLGLLLLMKAPGSMRRSVPYLVAALTVCILIYSMAILRIVPGLDMLLAPIPMITGKDLSFSGRTEIWAAILDHIRIRPLLGSGYGAYWAVGEAPAPMSESYVLISRLLGFYPASAHNGYLEVLNDLGTVGLLCLGGYLIFYVRQSLRLFSFDRTQGALFLALFLQQAITNLSESHWLHVTSFDFVVMSLGTISIGRALLDIRAWLQHYPKGPSSRQHNGKRPFVQSAVSAKPLIRPFRSANRGTPTR
jgi:O-antigen ligase